MGRGAERTFGRAALAGLLALGLACAAGTAGAVQEITVTNYGEMEPVIFNHTRHAEDLGCDTCHHAKGTEGAHRCGACHRGEDGKTLRFEEAAHKDGVGRCWPCHLAPKARKPLECEDCHRG